MYFEEVDFCLRASGRACPCWYVPACRVVHLVGLGEPGERRRARKRRPAYWFESRRRYFTENHGRRLRPARRRHVRDRLRAVARPPRDPAQARRDPPQFLRDFSATARGVRAPWGKLGSPRRHGGTEANSQSAPGWRIKVQKWIGCEGVPNRRSASLCLCVSVVNRAFSDERRRGHRDRPERGGAALPPASRRSSGAGDRFGRLRRFQLGDGSVDRGPRDGGRGRRVGHGPPVFGGAGGNAGFERLAAARAGRRLSSSSSTATASRTRPARRLRGPCSPAPSCAAVCGRRRERFPERSVYNRLADLEWDTPVGDARSCGGDAMLRVAAFDQVGGYDPTVIAGEEPELCVRLRARAGRSRGSMRK